MKKLVLTQPDDFHVHLRDGLNLIRTVVDTAAQFARAIVMPNLIPPITDVASAHAYRERIISQLHTHHTFTPLMTLYLTNKTTTSIIKEAANSHFVYACKLYPAGVTTNSNEGISTLQHIYPVIEAMETHNLPLLLHGEGNTPDADIFDREKLFLDTELTPLLKRFPKLRIVLEHITTAESVEFVKDAGKNMAATITAHHLLLTRSDLLKGGIHPHHYCLPILQTETDRQALLTAATCGNPQFFLGTDSAPHTRQTKECAAGCAGIYTAPIAMPLYASAFESMNALDKLEGFASHYGAAFYGLPVNQTTITLEKTPWTVPETLQFGNATVVPLYAGQTLQWQLTQIQN